MVNRLKGSAPFSLGPRLGDGDRTVTILDAAGEPFCIIHHGHCVGSDYNAAKARAQRIVEALNAPIL